MIFQLEVNDEDLAFVKKYLKYGSLTINRWSDEEAKVCSRLRDAGVMTQRPYYGDAICYHPSYELTTLGKKVMEQYETS